MKRFYLPILAVLFFVIPVSQSLAQFSVNNVSPAHGSVNVPLSTTLSIEFSQPLDPGNFDPFEGGDFPFDVALYPDSSETDGTFPVISADNKTISLAVELLANTRYTLVVSGAWNENGDALDKPVVTTFTTGATLPSGSISGQLTNAGGSSANALVSAFGGDFLDSDENASFAVANESGGYTIEYANAGEYAILAILDINGDGEPEPDDGDALGGYDPDGDKLADTIVLAEGETKSEVNFSLETLVGMTANAFAAKLDAAAQAIAADARAVGVVSFGLNAATGEAYFWTYIYHSASLQTHLGFFATSALCLPGVPDDGDGGDEGGFEEFLLDPLPGTRIDTDAALTIALENGGQEFIDANGEVTANVIGLNADPTEIFFGGGGGDEEGLAKKRFQDSKFPVRHLANLRHDQSAALSGLEAQPMWLFIFEAAAEPIGGGGLESFFFIGVNMETGEVIPVGPGFSTAKINDPVATAAAIDSVADAQLVGVEASSFSFTTPNLNPEGDATFWAFIFYSPSRDSFFQVIMSNGLVVREEKSEGWPTTQPIPENFIDSDAAINAAESNGGAAIRADDPAIFVEAQLAFGLNPENPQQLVWLVRYGKFNLGEEVVATFFVDGLTGAIVTDVAESPSLPPAGFALSPVYPNPIRAGNAFRVSFQLGEQSHVDLSVYNLLGQEVFKAASALKPAGAHTLSIADLPNDLASGTYFVRLRAVNRAGSVKLLTTRLIVR